MSQQEFLKFEETRSPYPFPLRRKAWFGVLFWEQDRIPQPYIWFLKLPLDETARLIQAARDDFLHRIIEMADPHRRAVSEDGATIGTFDHNPYTFEPKQEQMASFHAKALRELRLPASKHYAHAREYFAGTLGFEQWPFVGLQGIADVAARLDLQGNYELVAKAIPHLPVEPWEVLCRLMENEVIPISVADSLVTRVRGDLSGSHANPNTIAAGIRGISCADAAGLRSKLISEVLVSPYGTEVEVLTSIAGRAWEAMKDDEVRSVFMERLAENQSGQEYFNRSMADLLFIPGMRDVLLTSLRDPNRSENLSRAIGALFDAYTT